MARILVVEDQDSIREFTRAILKGAGHSVAVALDGAGAVAAVSDGAFDLILMDVSMPVMDGLTATRKIRALKGPRSKIPVIAFSADSASLEIGVMNDRIKKPFRKAELLLKVDTWLKHGRTGRSPGRPPNRPPNRPAQAGFEEACALMGRPWALNALRTLTTRIDEAFAADQDPSVPGDSRLRDQAHALVPLAALLGFRTLSDSCSALEAACRSGQDLRLPLAQARAAARKARTSALRLMADLQKVPQ